MKRFLILITIIILTGINLQAKPVAGVASISWDTTRSMTIAALIEQHTLTILKERTSFNTIGPGIINRELTKFECFDEKCISTFARNAGINLIINGSVQDRDTYLLITLRSYGVNRVHEGKLLYSYTVKIPLEYPAGSREFSLICEEHSALFLSATLSSFLHDIKITAAGNTLNALSEIKLNGEYTLYRKDNNGRLYKNGTITLTDNHANTEQEQTLEDDLFIIYSYKQESIEIKKHYRERKREILFHDRSIKDTLYIALLTPFASASMPFASPFLGYYMNNDWYGLGLWMVNATPYIYMEARGLYYSPSRLREMNEDITRDDAALHYFGWYMALAGGLPLFIDSYANNYLTQASYYSGETRLLGNNVTAAYLSLVSNGGGMFYKGRRGWGYFYFHLNNILLYSTIREFSTPEEYNPSTDSYIKKNTNSRNGKKLCAVLAVSKLIETVHTLVSSNDLESGCDIEEYIIPEPFFSFDDNNSPVYGLSLNYRF